MAVPVEEKPSAKLQITPLVSGASKTILAVNGGNSAGSRKIALRDSVSTAQQEFTRFDVHTSAECSITVAIQLGYLSASTKVSEPWFARVTFDTDGDEDAFANLARGYPDIRTVTPELPLKVVVPTGVTYMYVMGVVATGSTLANCVGDIFIEVN